MKFLRLLFIALSVIVLVLVLVGAVVLTPAFQTWAVRKLIGAPTAGAETAVGRVAIGFHRTELTAIKIEQPGLKLTVPSAIVELPIVSAAQKIVSVHRLIAKGWVLDLTVPEKPLSASANGRLHRAALGAFATLGLADVQLASAPSPLPAAASSASAVFDGVFKNLRLPFDLSIDEADLEGEVIFPSLPGRPPGRANVTITGGQLAAGREGRFLVTVGAQIDSEGASINHAAAAGMLAAQMDTPRSFERIALVADATASGPQFPQGTKIHADGSAARGPKGESYRLVLRSPDAPDGKNLLEVDASYPGEGQNLTGIWKMDAQDRDVAAFALGRPLPGFAATGGGDFVMSQRFDQIQTSGKFDATLDKLGSVKTVLAELGRIRVQGDFDLLQRGEITHIGRFKVQISGAKPVASVEALQELEFDAKTGELKVPDPTADLLRLTLQGVPLAWAQPFVENVSFAGDDLHGEFVASARGGGFTLRPGAPLAVANLTVSQGGRPLVRALDTMVALEFDYTPKGWQANVFRLALQSGGQVLLNASGRIGQQAGTNQPVKVAGRYSASLRAILGQPVAAPYASLASGAAEGSFSASLAKDASQVATKLELRELITTSRGELPKITSDIRADLHPDGRIDAHLPLLIEQAGRQSDVDINVSSVPDGARLFVDAQLKSNQIFTQDMQVFLAPLASGKTEPASDTNGYQSTNTPDRTPFWNGIGGQVKLALKKVIYSPEVQMTDVTGTMKIGPETLSLENLRAILGEGSEAKLGADVRFKPAEAAPGPYSFAANVNVTGFDPEPFFLALDPGKPATVEGKFELVGKLDGAAPTVAAMPDNANLDFKLTSRGGKFYGFARAAGGLNLGKAQEKVSTLSSIVGLAAAALGRSEVAALAEKARAASDVLKRFSDINFDQLNLEVSQRPGEAASIKDFSLISPGMRLNGVGSLGAAPEVSWLQRPLALDVQMAVRGAEASDFRVLGLLKGEPDSLGYSPLLDRFRIEGSLDNIGSTALTQLIQAKLVTQ